VAADDRHLQGHGHYDTCWQTRVSTAAMANRMFRQEVEARSRFVCARAWRKTRAFAVNASFAIVDVAADHNIVSGTLSACGFAHPLETPMTLPKPPKAFETFAQRYPKLGAAWEMIHDAGDDGPLDERTRRLVKLAVAIGALREGAVRASTRKAVAMGITTTEIEQVIALAAGTLGMPATVAVSTWVETLIRPTTTNE
jgi:alkylhydroperoxidase/carboxymuconolactone decarboxylase family protein YurZ